MQNERDLQSPDTGLACIILLSQYFEKAANPHQIVHNRGKASKPFIAEDILLAFKSLDLKARQQTDVTWERIQTIALPAMAERPDGSYVVLAKAAPDKVLLHDPVQDKPVVEDKDTFLQNFTGNLILVTRRAGLHSITRHFDVRWFIPEIWRHRRLFSEVLTASLFIQVIALITPLFFQVVVDKVLVHQSLTTLDVLIIGLVVVGIFDAGLSGLRAYLLAHTTSRIDVTLGARLFQHLLNLPLAYFQARRIGDTVARVRELETIRAFLTGSALTAVLDAVFVIVFLAVMFFYSKLLTGIVVAAIPLYVILCVLVAPVLRSRVEEKFARGADNQSFLVEAVNGIETIKSSAIEPQLRRRWEEQLAGYVQASFRAVNLGNGASQTAQLISKLTNALILWFGAQMVIENQMTVGRPIPPLMPVRPISALVKSLR